MCWNLTVLYPWRPASPSEETTVFRGTEKRWSCPSLHSIAVTCSTHLVSLEIGLRREAAARPFRHKGYVRHDWVRWEVYMRYCSVSWPLVLLPCRHDWGGGEAQQAEWLWVVWFVDMEWKQLWVWKKTDPGGESMLLNRISVISSCQHRLIHTTSNAKTFPEELPAGGINLSETAH